MGPATYKSIDELKALRVQVDAAIQEAEKYGEHEIECKNPTLYGMAHYQAEIKLREAKMWIGKMMEGLGSELPQEFRDQAPKE